MTKRSSRWHRSGASTVKGRPKAVSKIYDSDVQERWQDVYQSIFGVCETWTLPSAVNQASVFLTQAPRFQSAATIAARIDATIADDDLYETDEPRPSTEAASKAKDLIKAVEQWGSRLPAPKISVYFGELDITWTVDKRVLRLIILADRARPAVLYFQTDDGNALTRGESVDVGSPTVLSQKLDWLLG